MAECQALRRVGGEPKPGKPGYEHCKRPATKSRALIVGGPNDDLVMVIVALCAPCYETSRDQR